MGASETRAGPSSEFSHDASDVYTQSSYEKQPLFTRVIDSFKPISLEDDGVDTSQMTEMEKSIYATSRHPLARSLKGRHLQMIAIGGSIGTGLFVGSGYALWLGGPAGQLISYLLVGYSLYCVVNALGEMSVQFPVSGSFNAFFSRFVDPAWGFTLGLLYALSWLISFPSELIACSITIQYWNSSINPAVWIAIFYVVICSINLFGVKGYGEVEFSRSWPLLGSLSWVSAWYAVQATAGTLERDTGTIRVHLTTVSKVCARALFPQRFRLVVWSLWRWRHPKRPTRANHCPGPQNRCFGVSQSSTF